MSQEEFSEELNNKLSEFVRNEIKEKGVFEGKKIKEIYNVKTRINSNDIPKLLLANDFTSIIFYISFNLDLIPDWEGEDGGFSSSLKEYHKWKVEVKTDKSNFLLENLDTNGI